MPNDALALAFRSFHLPTMAAIWEPSVERAERENWGYRRLLQHLCESEDQDRRERRVARLLKESGLPIGKSLGNLDKNLCRPRSDGSCPACWRADSWSEPRTFWRSVCRAGAGRMLAAVARS